MPIIVYIPKRYDNWYKIPKDVRDEFIKSTKEHIREEEKNYDYEGVEIPEAAHDLELMWNELVKSGNVSNAWIGYYNSDTDSYYCCIFEKVFQLAKRFNLLLSGVITSSSNCVSYIINIGSEVYLSDLRTLMIGEIFR